ncbi:MAG TPA: hypothetical protein VIK55_09160 [Paludibacter sp.]
MKIFTLICAILYSFTLTAQDCTEELLLQKPGTWKTGIQGSINGVIPADLVKEKSVLAAIHKMENTKYNPKGCQVLYSTSYSKYPSAGDVWISDPYEYTMFILPFLCDSKSADQSKYTVAIASATNVTISANEISWLNTLYAATIHDDFRGYYKLEDRPVKKGGYYFFGEDNVNPEQEIVEYRWLITYNDALPFSYLNRREYLQLQQKRLEKSIKESPGEKEYFQKFLDNISEYLTKPDSELSQTAICMSNDEEQFSGFVEEGTKGSFIAVKPNLEYYNKKLPMSSPQFFTVIYTLSQGEPVFEENIAAIKEATDFAALKNMLGK